MKTSIYQKALCGLAAVLFGITGVGTAQESGTVMSLSAPPCATDSGCPDGQISIAAAGIPPMGLPQVGVVTTGGMGLSVQESTELVKHLPYQAVAITEIKQTLADGSHTTQTTTATVARDSDGRTVRVQHIGSSAVGSSQGNLPTLTTIFDPVANTHTDFTSDSKVAHVLKMPPLPPNLDKGDREGRFAVFAGGPAGGSTDGGIGPMTFTVQGHASRPQATPDQSAPDAKTASLGSKTIEGIPVTGTKTTTTIPAGAIGNDRDLVTTRETWYSADLKLVIQSTQTDPRFGETTYSLTNIQRSEPDPAIFQVPAGYTIDKLPVVVHQR